MPLRWTIDDTTKAQLSKGIAVLKIKWTSWQLISFQQKGLIFVVTGPCDIVRIYQSDYKHTLAKRLWQQPINSRLR